MTRYLEDVRVGEEIPALVRRPSRLQLFRFSAVTWNAHRIHYDRDYAAEEGYADVLVQSHLHGCYLMDTLLAWAGAGAHVVAFGWRNAAVAVPGDTLTCTGRVVDVSSEGEVSCELEERNQRGELCAPATATVRLERRARGGGADG
ncbi:MAG: acyl dehydratase [Propionibacteriales bacterium]|nr:acyl dehydratase [Propionibacteriales bacterium]